MRAVWAGRLRRCHLFYSSSRQNNKNVFYAWWDCGEDWISGRHGPRPARVSLHTEQGWRNKQENISLNIQLMCVYVCLELSPKIDKNRNRNHDNICSLGCFPLSASLVGCVLGLFSRWETAFSAGILSSTTFVQLQQIQGKMSSDETESCSDSPQSSRRVEQWRRYRLRWGGISEGESEAGRRSYGVMAPGNLIKNIWHWAGIWY